jgi:uncharacterized membrane protein
MDEITAKNIKTITALDHEHDATLSKIDRVANAISNFAGSISFIIVHILFFSTWIAVNLFFKFDKFPFAFLMVLVSLEAIFLSGLVLMGQNISAEKQDKRHKLGLQINLLAEQENTATMKVLARIAEKLQVPADELRPYLTDTDPAEVLKVIETEEHQISSTQK